VAAASPGPPVRIITAGQPRVWGSTQDRMQPGSQAYAANSAVAAAWPQQLLTAPSWQLAAADFMRLAHACVAGSSCSEFALRNSHLAAAHPC
jgi:hypothetical protein